MCTGDEADHADARASYEARLATLKADATVLGERDKRLSSVRGLLFLATVGGALYGLAAPRVVTWLGVGVVALAFVVFVVRHALVSTQQFDNERRVAYHKTALERIAGRYRAPDGDAQRRGDGWVNGEHPYSDDLDLFGRASLFERLNVTETPGGAARLAAWLSSPAAATSVRARQRAVRELAGLTTLREEMSLAGLQAGPIDRDATPFLTWARERATFAESGAVATIVALALVALSFACLAMSSLYGGMWTKIWGGSLALNVMALMVLRPRLEPVLAPICLKQSPLGHYRQLLALAEGAPFDDEALRTIQQRLCERGATASAAMDRLEKLIGLAAVRHNALIYILADVFALWDVWCAFLIDRWRAAHGARVATWLEALAELEALVSLATFAHEHPEHAWPVLTDGPPRFVASALGHPLIDPEQRVANDVALTDDHPALMITGSNMSGKSTMLRSIGINAVLAQAGAPVCAQSLEMTPLAVHTSMRAHDDLDRGASRFFAEVAKLQRTVAALEATRATDPTLLFLLDEVLHGTNSRERNIGAKAVVRYLVDRGAIGAVSSHDLGLVELSKLTDGRVVNVHFEDHIADDKMCFDYRMKPGPVSTSNALRLMRMVGIDVPGLDP